MVSNDERVDRYADAIFDEVVDHPMWIGDDGEPLDYLPERATRLTDFIYEAAAAVIAVADAEQAELRADLTYAIADAKHWHEGWKRSDEERKAVVRELADERAKVARVEALADDLWGDPAKPHDGRDAAQTIYRHIVAQIRAALDAE